MALLCESFMRPLVLPLWLIWVGWGIEPLSPCAAFMASANLYYEDQRLIRNEWRG